MKQQLNLSKLCRYVMGTMLLSQIGECSSMEYFRGILYGQPTATVPTATLNPVEKSKFILSLSLINENNNLQINRTEEFSSQANRLPISLQQKGKFSQGHFKARSPKEVTELNMIFSENYETTLYLTCNGTYPAWYNSEEWFQCLRNIPCLHELNFSGSGMVIYNDGLKSFADNLLIADLKNLKFGKHNYYLDAGMKPINDLLTLMHRNHDHLETFSMPLGQINPKRVAHFISNLPSLPALKHFNFCGTCTDHDLTNLATIFKTSLHVTKFSIKGDFETSENGGFLAIVSILENLSSLHSLSLRFGQSDILPQLINILKIAKIEKLSLSSSSTSESYLELGRLIGSQGNMTTLELDTLPSDCAEAFFKGLSESNETNHTLMHLKFSNWNQEFSDETGMKAFGAFLESNKSIVSLYIPRLWNEQSAEILFDSLQKRQAPLQKLEIYYWGTTASIQKLFIPLTSKTEVKFFG